MYRRFHRDISLYRVGPSGLEKPAFPNVGRVENYERSFARLLAWFDEQRTLRFATSVADVPAKPTWQFEHIMWGPPPLDSSVRKNPLKFPLPWAKARCRGGRGRSHLGCQRPRQISSIQPRIYPGQSSFHDICLLVKLTVGNSHLGIGSACSPLPPVGLK